MTPISRVMPVHWTRRGVPSARFLLAAGLIVRNVALWPKAADHHLGGQTSALGLPSDFVRKCLLLLRSGDVREFAAASYPHIHCGGGDFPFIAGGGCGGWRLT